MERQFSILSLRIPWTYEKAKRQVTERWIPQVSRCPICYRRSVEKQLQKEWRDAAKSKTTPSVDVTSKVQWYKEQYCIGTWNLRSMHQGKLEVVKQEMARVNVDILGISKLKWTGVGESNSDDCCIYHCRQESLRRNGVAIIVNKSPKCSTWVQSQKQQNDICPFPRQTIQYNSNPSLCPDQ